MTYTHIPGKLVERDQISCLELFRNNTFGPYNLFGYLVVTLVQNITMCFEPGPEDDEQLAEVPPGRARLVFA